jgi:hypothetical protein
MDFGAADCRAQAAHAGIVRINRTAVNLHSYQFDIPHGSAIIGCSGTQTNNPRRPEQRYKSATDYHISLLILPSQNDNIHVTIQYSATQLLAGGSEIA